MKKKTGLIILWVVIMTAFLVACNRTKEDNLLPLKEEFSFETDPVTESKMEETENEEELQMLVVHICGAVKSPGVYELPVGSRYCDAVEAAGGFAKDAGTDYLNMARFLQDGMRLDIPTLEEVEWANQQGAILSDDGMLQEYSAGDGLIDINTADISKLCSLPGIGESRAKSIIAYRQEHGAFHKKEDIMNVAGIKSGMYEKIKALITVR